MFGKIMERIRGGRLSKDQQIRRLRRLLFEADGCYECRHLFFYRDGHGTHQDCRIGWCEKGRGYDPKLEDVEPL
jgi:hypothetical protein